MIQTGVYESHNLLIMIWNEKKFTKRNTRKTQKLKHIIEKNNTSKNACAVKKDTHF